MNRRGFLTTLAGLAAAASSGLSLAALAPTRVLATWTVEPIANLRAAHGITSGYQGRRDDEADSGYFYCPYIPLES